MKIIKYESETFLPAILQEKFETTIKRVQENKYEQDKIRCTIESLKGDIIRWLAENSVNENKLKNLGEGEAGTGYALLSDVIDLINKSNDMLKDIYCNVDLPKSLYTKDNDIRDRVDANTVILNKCKEYLCQ